MDTQVQSATSTVGSTSVTTMTGSTNTDGWKYRRRFMIAMTIFFMAVVLLALLVAKTASVAEIAVISGIGALVSIFGFYVAGAVWDDHSIRQFQISSLTALKGGTPPSDGQ